MKDFDDHCECARDNFCSFVQNNEKYTAEEADYLIEHSLGRGVSKIFRVGYVLIVWSFVAVWIDNLLIPGAIGYSIFHGEISWATATPLFFLVGNATLKAIFIKWRMGKKIGVLGAYLSAVPYIGFAFLLKTQFKTDKLLYVASKDYFLYQKTVVKNAVRGFLGMKEVA
ncbi:hypothetical protein EI427_03640 [Flammeovirga pectinis]|uniref:Uncharacterized protein n=1 Tax=Flammeovirga pectinis TaxID=2494373 RepID=A0A3Q9FNY7_9BACT|nr:hypothetical protein [Flammeovirga pectinis]AZQ61346.1 hypothetical protein EI427_03640 [Flammeovirga pectinis]